MIACNSGNKVGNEKMLILVSVFVFAVEEKVQVITYPKRDIYQYTDEPVLQLGNPRAHAASLG